MTEDELRSLLEQEESEGLEFKPSMLDLRDLAEYAVGIGNAGGGWLLIGVSDRRPRRILPFPMPSDAEVARARESVADAAQIHLSAEVIGTPNGRVLAFRIPGRPRGNLFHTRGGKYLIRLGEGLRGMTPAEIDAIRREAGEEPTRQVVQGALPDLISSSGMEELRRLMAEARAEPDLLELTDSDLLRALGVLSAEGKLTVAGLLLAGKQEAIVQRVPFATWQFRRMVSDTDYDQADEGVDPIPVALRRIRELVNANNPVLTIPGWLTHPEFPRYPVLALRELLVNAFGHRDYQMPGPVAVKLYPDRLEISNPGGFIEGVTPENILHHPSAPRCPALFHALTRIRLANHSNLGVPRVFRDLLSEGKEPPVFWASARAVRVTLKGQEARREFLELVDTFPQLGVDQLLIIHYLTRHREITAARASEICQRPVELARETLVELLTGPELLERGGGPGAGRYYRLSRRAYDLLFSALSYHVDRRLGLENAKARVLAVLRERPLSNADIREITQLGRYQVVKLMDQLRAENLVDVRGTKRAARWHLKDSHH